MEPDKAQLITDRDALSREYHSFLKEQLQPQLHSQYAVRAAYIPTVYEIC